MIKRKMEEEEGNVTLFVIGFIGIMMVLFVLIINMSGALVVKEQSATTSEQASLTASSVIYEEVQKAIEEFDTESLEGDAKVFFEDFNENKNEKISDLNGQAKYREWSEAEIEVEALDQMISDELRNGKAKKELKELLQDKMNESIRQRIVEKTKQAIAQNDGDLENAQLRIDNNRIYVRASNEFEATAFKSFFNGIKENIFQVGGGPQIDYLETIWGDNPRVIALQ